MTPEEFNEQSRREEASRSRQKATSASNNRESPHSAEGEIGLLCSILNAPDATCALAAKRKLTPGHFHLSGHDHIYRAAMRMWDEKKPIDLVTLTQELRDRSLLDSCGGAAALTAIYTYVGTANNADHYAEILHEKHLLREIIRRQSKTTERAHFQQADLTAILDTVQRDAIDLAQIQFGANTSETMHDLVMASIHRVEERSAQGTGMVGMETGIKALDTAIGGYVRGEYICIQAARSQGKTANALTTIWHQAVKLGIPCGMTSLDMPRLDIVDRLICMEAGVHLERYRRGQLDEADFPKVTAAASRLAEAPIYIDDRTQQTGRDIRASILLMAQEHGIHLWCLDYIQKVHCRANSDEKRYEQIAAVSSEMKDLARDANVAALILSQVNTNGEVAGTKEIIDHADIVLGHCDREGDEPDKVKGRFAIRVNKYRNGERDGEVPCFFNKPLTRFEDARDEHAEQPNATVDFDAAQGRKKAPAKKK